jgi:hypothetical protein
VDGLPAPVRRVIAEHQPAARFIAFLSISRDGTVAAAGGDLERCGIDGLEPTARATEVAPFLVGLLPLGGRPFELACAEVRPGSWVHVHVFAAGDHDWVVFLDCSDEALELQRRQQEANQQALGRARRPRATSAEGRGRPAADTEDPP